MYPTGLYEVPVLEAAEDCFAAKKGTDSWGEVNRIWGHFSIHQNFFVRDH